MTAPRALPSRRRSRTAPRRLPALVVGALTAVLLGLGIAPAQAHDALVATAPLNTEVLSTAPATVELTFTGEPLPLGTEVLVLGPDGAQASTGAAEIRGTTVVQPLAGSLPAGSYTVEWRSTSSDGHPLTGSLAFSVAGDGPAPTSSAAGDPAAGAGTTVTPDPQSATTAATEPADGGLPAGWLVAGVVALAALGALLFLRLRRRA